MATTRPKGASVDLERLRIEEPASSQRSRFASGAIMIVLAAIAFVAGWWIRGGPGNPAEGPVAVRVATVRPGGAGKKSSGFSEGGWVEVPSYHPIVVTALTHGRVEELTVLEGSRVKKGEVVARIYAADLERALRRAGAEVAEAKASLDLLSAGFRKEEVAKARVELARLEEVAKLAARVLARTQALVPTGAASREQAERDQSALEVAQKHVEAAREELRKLEAGYRVEEVEKARATLARAEAARDLAQARLSYVEVKSPAAGVVLERFVTPGTWLSPDNPRVIALYDPDDLQVRVDVRQENRGQLSVGQKVEVTTQAEPRRVYPGTVIRLEPLADFKKNTIQAKIRIDEPSDKLHPEMICRVRFARAEQATPSEEKQPITVPATALVRENGATFVFLVKDGRARKVAVRGGVEDNGRIAILSGLADGDRFVVAPPPGLQDGAEVTE
jgi:multidrug efflux pump subunit AcrA (membrane-fusion protein)